MKTPCKMDFFLPQSTNYGVLNHFTKKIMEVMQHRGFMCRLFTEGVIEEILQDPPDVVLSYNGVPEHSSGVLLCDLLEKPSICCIVDLAYRYQYLTESPYVHIGCNDLFSERMFHENNFPQAFFFPVAADSDAVAPVNQDRPIDILLMATYIDYEGRRKHWPRLFSDPMVKIIQQAAELAFVQEGMSLVEAYQLVLNTALHKKEPLVITTQIIKRALMELELYVRGRDRAELIDSIKHLPVHVYNGTVEASNWEGFFKGKKTNLIFHPPVSFEENLKVLAQSKIVLNSSPHTRHGASERVFNALAAGALPITNQSYYMDSIFDTEKEILFYRHKDLQLVEPLLESYLKDPEKLMHVARLGQAKVIKDHTWENRADLLINYIGDKIGI